MPKRPPRQRPPTPARPAPNTAAIGVAVALAVALAAVALFGQGDRRVRVERVRAPAPDADAPHIVAGGTCVDEWPALQTWTAAYLSPLARRAGLTMFTVPRDRNALYGDGSRPLGRLLPAESYASTYTKQPADFTRHDPAARFYFKARPEDFGAPEVAAAIRPYQCLLAPDVDEAWHDRDVWIGEAGVVAAAHYDHQVNFYTMIRGTKRFEFWPPGAFADLDVYPATHPRVRQAAAAEAMPPALVVDVHAGETLFIPPFWFHRVTAVTDSISVSTCSPSVAEETLDAVEHSPLPFESDWPRADFVRAVAGYARAILDRPLADVLRQRYRAVGELAAASIPVGEMDAMCAGEHTHRYDIERGVRAARQQLARIADSDIRGIVTMTFVEEMVAALLGADVSYGFFVGECIL